MKEWIESVVADLKEEAGGGKRLVSALTLAYCFWKLGINHPKYKEFVFPVLEMLQLSVDTETRTCPEYDFACSSIQTKYR